MWAGVKEIGWVVGVRWVELSIVTGAVWAIWCRMQVRVAEGRRGRRQQEELRAYARLDVQLAPEEGIAGLARNVSRLMAEKSVFPRTAMLVRDSEGRLGVAASAGMDEQAVRSLNAWAEGVGDQVRGSGMGGRRAADGFGRRVGFNGFAIVLGEAVAEFDMRQAIVLPLWTTGGRMLGALAVGADGLLSVRRGEVEEALGPLEALSVKVARSMENAALADRLTQAERLAGLGLLAGDMAHALSNPLTAVLGLAELIASSTSDARVKTDAATIVQEAQKMRRTAETMLNFGRPLVRTEPVDLLELVTELEGASAKKFDGLGIQLLLQTDDDVPSVKGDRQRLRQLLEHLLSNAFAGAKQRSAREEQVIRMSLTTSGEASEREPGRRVHLIVSDTGPGFHEPGRVFDPLRTIRGESETAGLSLSLSYGIVQEHGGEIIAFNMHPHGAAVAVDLPVISVPEREPIAMETEASRVSV